MFRVACALAVLTALIVPMTASAQMSYRYPYRYGFTRGQYPYYYSSTYPTYYNTVYPNYYGTIFPSLETSVHYQPQYQMVYYPALGYSLRFEGAGTSSPIWGGYQGVVPGGTAPQTRSPDNTVTIDVRVVDPDAEVWVDDHKTTQKGTQRRYTTPPLTPGKQYKYEIRVESMRDGKKVEQKQEITFEAGQHVGVDFFTR